MQHENSMCRVQSQMYLKNEKKKKSLKRELDATLYVRYCYMLLLLLVLRSCAITENYYLEIDV